MGCRRIDGVMIVSALLLIIGILVFDKLSEIEGARHKYIVITNYLALSIVAVSLLVLLLRGCT